MPLHPGEKLGPYEVVAPLGAGGMGEVYRARDARLGRDVAIKILPKEMSADQVRKQRCEREAKTISGLNHPNICVLHDVGSQDGVDYLVMECVQGETLAERLTKGPLPPEQVLRYGAQIADALDKAHRSGVVHRDLKPGNIMLTKSGAKLLDFGLARPTATSAASLATLTNAAPASPMTQEGVIVGTFQYMSPEQVEGREVDGRSDIFSLGAVLYEMVTGKRAFEGKSQLSVASAILEKEPEPISAVQPLTPLALDRTIQKCLAKKPDERWQSASDLATQLSWMAEGSASGIAPAAKVTAGGRDWRWLGWVLSGLLMLLVDWRGGDVDGSARRGKGVARDAVERRAARWRRTGRFVVVVPGHSSFTRWVANRVRSAPRRAIADLRAGDWGNRCASGGRQRGSGHPVFLSGRAMARNVWRRKNQEGSAWRRAYGDRGQHRRGGRVLGRG